MKDPLIPFAQYEEFAKLQDIDNNQKLDFIKEQLDLIKS